MSSNQSENTRSAQAISNAITKLQRDHYGRGPESVRTVVGYDHIICFLEDTFMPVEVTLIDAGETAAVRETRLAFQRAMESRFVQQSKRSAAAGSEPSSRRSASTPTSPSKCSSSNAVMPNKPPMASPSSAGVAEVAPRARARVRVPPPPARRGEPLAPLER